jgi:hypothetical protein
MKFSTTVALAGFATSAAAFTPSAFMGKTQISDNVVKSTSSLDMKYNVAVIGGGPAGACAAEIFAQEKNINTFLFERKLDNAKPCGGAIPLCMVGEFELPESVVDRKVRSILFNFCIETTCFLESVLSCRCDQQDVGNTRKEKHPCESNSVCRSGEHVCIFGLGLPRGTDEISSTMLNFCV